jgi:hypothetical protein
VRSCRRTEHWRTGRVRGERVNAKVDQQGGSVALETKNLAEPDDTPKPGTPKSTQDKKSLGPKSNDET